MSKNTTNHLQLPNLLQDKISIIKTATSHLRKSGARINHQIINGKHIFHNYGLGPASIILSYGASYLSSKSYTVFVDPKNQNKAAVIGAGVMGLVTAIQLAKRGKKVTIYAQNIPEKQGSLISSQILPVVWVPSDYYWNQDLLTHELSCKLSYENIKQSLGLNRYQSLKQIQVYELDAKKQQLKELISSYVFQGFKETKISYHTNTIDQATTFKSIHINSLLYLQQLKIQAVLRGISIVQKSFKNIEQILSLPQISIYNCSGAVGNKIFNDSQIIPTSRIIIEFDQPSNHIQQFSFRKNSGDLQFQLQCLGKKTYLILKDNKTNLSKNQIRQKLVPIFKYINDRSLNPKL